MQKNILFMKRKLNEILALHTGKSIEQIEQDTDRDNFARVRRIDGYGLIDKVYTSRSEIKDNDKMAIKMLFCKS